MTKITGCILILLIIFSCNTSSKVLQLIVYTDFVNPKKTYDTFRKDLEELGLMDSVKIIGRPIFVNSIESKIDTSLVLRYGLSLEAVQKKLNESLKLKTFSLDNLNEIHLTTDTEQQIPLTYIVDFQLALKAYEPKVFLPVPENFTYRDRRAVKVEIFCSKKNRRTLVDFIENNMDRYSDEFSIYPIEYELVE